RGGRRRRYGSGGCGVARRRHLGLPIDGRRRTRGVQGGDRIRCRIEMTRIVVRGGWIFDGTGADPADGDVAIEDGRIVDVGTGLDGDEAVDVGERGVVSPPLR